MKAHALAALLLALPEEADVHIAAVDGQGYAPVKGVHPHRYIANVAYID